MPLTTEKKTEVFSNHRRHDKDTGSAEVQAALLTSQIKHLTEHLKIHKKRPLLATRPPENGRQAICVAQVPVAE